MNVDAVVKRAYLTLEDGDFSKANELLDQALNEDPENAVVYVGLLCAELKVHSESELANCKAPIADYNNFKKAVRFGDDALVTKLNDYNTVIVTNLAIADKKRGYSSVMPLLAIISNNPEATPEQCIRKAAALSDIAKKLRAVGDYEDARAVADKCESDAADLTALSEQRKRESIASTAIKKKKTIKWLFVTGIIVVLATAGVFTYGKNTEYNKSLPDKYFREYQAAFNDGNYAEAQNSYKKLLDVNHVEEGYSGTLDDFIEECNIAKISEEGLQSFVDGDFEKGKELFAKNDEERNWKASLYYVPYNHIKKLLPQLLENLNPVQIQLVTYGYYSNNELYWLNSDGTVGTIDGNPCVSDWKDIVKIKADTIVAGLRKDGTLIYKCGDDEAQTIDNVIDFDVSGNYIAVVKTDGMVTCNNQVSGSEFVTSWTNIKTVRISNEPLIVQYLDWGPDSNYQEPVIQNATGGSNPYLVAQTNDETVLTSGFNQKIYPPNDATEEDILNSLKNAPSWGAVIDPTLRASLQTPLQNGYTQLMEPASVDTDFSEPTKYELSLSGRSTYIERDSNGKWIVY